MAITDDDRSMILPARAEKAGSRKPTLRAVLEALATGRSAAADLRRLEGRGLSRAELPGELFRRHFAGRSDR